MNVETKEQITITEFKAWLTGLIRGKQGSLPNLDDWREIKKMLDKVQEEPTTVPNGRDPSELIGDGALEKLKRRFLEEQEKKEIKFPPYANPWISPAPNDIAPWKYVPSTPNYPSYIPTYVGDYPDSSKRIGDVVLPSFTTIGDYPDSSTRIGDVVLPSFTTIRGDSGPIGISSSGSIASELKNESFVKGLIEKKSSDSEEDPINFEYGWITTSIKDDDMSSTQFLVGTPSKEEITIHRDLIDQITQMIERNTTNGSEEKSKNKE